MSDGYIKIGNANTVGELKKILETVPDDFTWNGWDDGSLCLHGPNRDYRSIDCWDSDDE